MKLERFLYIGSDEIAVPTLHALAAAETVLAVVTQPDRPSGRKRRLTPCPVKEAALALGLPVLDPESVGDAEAALQALHPDLAVVFAYGQYLPRRIYDLPREGSINLHPSLLPRYRGASPIQSALLDGCWESGMSVLRVGARMDAGDLLLQRRIAIGENEDAASLRERFAQMGAGMIVEALAGLREGSLTWQPQDEAAATECGKLCKEDGWIDWRGPADKICCQVRGCQPWPGASFAWEDGERIKVYRTRVESAQGRPGSVLERSGEGPLVACGRGALRLLELQAPGKSRMSGRDFLNGYGAMLPEILP